MKVLILLLFVLISCGTTLEHPAGDYDCEYSDTCEKENNKDVKEEKA